MVYLQPLGGLCNRIRTVDSLINLCQENKADLTVFWVKNAALNADYQDLFEMPRLNDIDIHIVNCPSGFPDQYIGIKDRLKNWIKGKRLNGRYKEFLKEIKVLPMERILLKDELQPLYDSGSYINTHTASEMDAMLYPKIEKRIDSIFSNRLEDSYIASCYRLSPVQDAYKKFVPSSELKERIDQSISSFNKTIGLHIRKSDHETSRKFSTTEKFLCVIENELANDAKTTFFISTDDEETKSKLIDTYKERIFYNKVSSYDRNSPEAVKDAVVDLYCLAATSKLYGSHHSSFSQVAAIIGGIKEDTVK